MYLCHACCSACQEPACVIHSMQSSHGYASVCSLACILLPLLIYSQPWPVLHTAGAKEIGGERMHGGPTSQRAPFSHSLHLDSHPFFSGTAPPLLQGSHKCHFRRDASSSPGRPQCTSCSLTAPGRQWSWVGLLSIQCGLCTAALLICKGADHHLLGHRALVARPV